MTNLTPAQLEQFESTFRYFDKDESNTLSPSEMTAALASLGIVYSEEDMIFIYDQLVEDYGAVTFEAFINLLVTPFTTNIVSTTKAAHTGRHYRRSDFAATAARSL